MLESVNMHSAVSAVDQIVNSVKADIASGALKPGDRLLSMQELAEKLNLNFNTVNKAYRDLEVLGYIQGRRGTGVFVRQGADQKCRQDVRESIVRGLYEVLADVRSAGIANADVQELVKMCLDSDAGPYGDAPKSLLAMAKRV